MSRLTIKEIAELAGVNKATVSRVLNGNANISEKTRQKIMDIVREHNYVPNATARALASNRTYTVGFCFDYTNRQAYANPFFSEVLQGIEEVIYANDYLFLMMSVHDIDQSETTTFQKIVREHRVDGVLIPESLLTDEHYRFLQEYQMPFVVLGEPSVPREGVRWVDVDNAQAAEMLTERLIRRGCKDIRMMGSADQANRDIYVENRMRGFRDAMERNGLTPRTVEPAQWEDEHGSFSSEQGVPDALIVASQGKLYEWLEIPKKDEAIKIPVASFDDHPLYRHLPTPVESIQLQLDVMGTEAARLLLQVIDGSPDAPPHVNVRVQH
ncbi:LacI family DNA-binding transcriptional regulator [Cohnella cholangitidis]|nr:LacI family DNA-binding transcriptional regulator [Cohnella cholangitidis]